MGSTSHYPIPYTPAYTRRLTKAQPTNILGPTDTPDQCPPADDVTHLPSPAYKLSKQKRRTPLEPDQPPSPPKQIRLRLLQPPNTIPQYQVLLPVYETSGCSSQGFSWSPSNKYLNRSKLASTRLCNNHIIIIIIICTSMYPHKADCANSSGDIKSQVIRPYGVGIVCLKSFELC